MTTSSPTKQERRIRRHKRVRAKINGTAQRPRVAVFKSNQHMYVQAIDDVTNKTLVGVHDTVVKKKGAKAEKASAIAELLAEQLKKLGISEVVFDAGGFKYHGRVKAVAEGLRASGIKV